MKNIDLECQPGWRYCRVMPGEKRPYPAGWQRTPLELSQVDSTNVGVLLGPESHGVVALDFDGTSSWQWFDQVIGGDLPTTVMWTSGKQDRCQMAFQVPARYWFYLRSLKIGAAVSDWIAPGEGFEFRWAGGQSVVPPSRLADGREYTWIHRPSQSTVADLPDAVLAYWLEQSNPVVAPTPVRDLSQLSNQDLLDIESLLMVLHHQHAVLDYDTWRTVAWATAHHVGPGAAGIIMNSYWPEKKPGEYARLYRGYDPSRSPSIRTVRHLLGADAQTDIELARADLQIQITREMITKWQ